jgi:uncharacterized damage-inducible protein DinB
MTPEQIRELYDFNAWANQRVFDACAALTSAQFSRAVVSSYPSVRETLAHIVTGEWVWLELWLGRMHPAAERQNYAAQFVDLAKIRTGWSEVERERQPFLDALTPPGLGHVIEYTSLMGNRCAYTLRRMMQHVVNHSTYHRGQVATMLRQLGAEPRPTDYLRYFDWLGGQPED